MTHGATALASERPVSVATEVGGRFVVRPAPRREPPFDDETQARHLSLVGPFDRPLPFELDDASAPSALRLSVNRDAFAAQPTGRSNLPELQTFSRRFVIGVIEAATGRRSAAQLNRHTAPAVQAGLARDAGRITRLGTAQRPAQLHSLHTTEPADGVAEVAAIVRVEDRFRAIAFRLEGLDGRWRCVRLQIG
ncbi:MAG TPA: Rv3235 family protein [Jatrophihabitans sp.]|jgi:hypothetical protein